MSFEYILRISASFLVTVYVSRYLGPESIGTISYLISILSILVIFGLVGFDSTLTKNLIWDQKNSNKILGTAFFSILFTNGLIFFGILFFYHINKALTYYYLLLLSPVLLLSSFKVLEYYFQSIEKYKLIFKIKLISSLISIIIKLFFIFYEYPLIYFIVSYAIDAVTTSALLLTAYLLKKNLLFFKNFNAITLKKLLRSSVPMFLASLSTVIYIRMIKL